MNNKENKKFDLSEMPTAYFCDNKKANGLRAELIRNQVSISECAQGELEETFFSKQNISNINKQLIYTVWKKTDGLYKISEQSAQSLVIVMRYVFIEYARHLPYDIKGQIKELNNIVVGEIAQNVITNATQRVGYLKDIQNPIKPLPLPMNTSNNAKDLPSVSTILFSK
jgi:hypothetical protein